MLGFNRTDARLTWNFFKMYLRDRYLGSRLGSLWAVANPILMLAIFTYVFGFVMKAKAPGAETTLSYVAWLISGYGPWLAIAESTTSATGAIVGGSAIVKNMPIKTEVLPIAAALLGVVPLIVSLTFLAGILLADGNPPTWHAALVLPVVVLQFLLVVALGLLAAPLNVFVRDFGVVLPNLLLIILLSTPIFYPLEAVPALMRTLSEVNPFFIITDAYRDTLIHHRVPRLEGLFFVLCFSLVLGYVGLRMFRRLKGYFSALL